MSNDESLAHPPPPVGNPVHDTFSLVTYLWQNAHTGIGIGLFLVLFGNFIKFLIAPCSELGIRAYSYLFTEKLKES